MIADQYIYKKEVDRSLLKEGFGIPFSIQHSFHIAMKDYIKRGESKEVILIIEGNYFKAKLINQKFDKDKYSDHADVLQIRYNPGSDLSNWFKNKFSLSVSYFEQSQLYQIKTKKHARVPENKREYIAIYTTTIENTFYVDCITAEELWLAREWTSLRDETDLENFLYSADPDATILEQSRLVKIRKLDRAIGNNLKIFYHFKCQVCGQNIGERYNERIAHIHHISPFSTSLNNSSSNLMVICPNHHSVLHIAEPFFDLNSLTFKYKNGYQEKLLLNNHL